MVVSSPRSTGSSVPCSEPVTLQLQASLSVQTGDWRLETGDGMAHAIQTRAKKRRRFRVAPGGEPCSPRRRRRIPPNVDARSRRQTVRSGTAVLAGVCRFVELLVVVGPDGQDESRCRDAPVDCRGCVVQCQLYIFSVFCRYRVLLAIIQCDTLEVFTSLLQSTKYLDRQTMVQMTAYSSTEIKNRHDPCDRFNLALHFP